MAASITNRIDVSKEKLAELREDAVRRARHLQEVATQKSEIALGSIRDGGLTGLLTFGGSALGTAASMAKQLPLAEGVARKLDGRASALAEASEEIAKPNIENYDELNVKKVSAALEGLDAWELLKVKRYEEAHKDRKTVHAAVERRLA